MTQLTHLGYLNCWYNSVGNSSSLVDLTVIDPKSNNIIYIYDPVARFALVAMILAIVGIVITIVIEAIRFPWRTCGKK